MFRVADATMPSRLSAHHLWFGPNWHFWKCKEELVSAFTVHDLVSIFKDMRVPSLVECRKGRLTIDPIK